MSQILPCETLPLQKQTHGSRLVQETFSAHFTQATLYPGVVKSFLSHSKQKVSAMLYFLIGSKAPVKSCSLRMTAFCNFELND